MILKTEQEVNNFLDKRYWLSNYEPGRITLFMPAPYGGSCGYIYGDLAEKLGQLHDPWNYNIWRERLAACKENSDSVLPYIRRECKCSLRTKLVGDGCAVCNPKLAEELAQNKDGGAA